MRAEYSQKADKLGSQGKRTAEFLDPVKAKPYKRPCLPAAQDAAILGKHVTQMRDGGRWEGYSTPTSQPPMGVMQPTPRAERMGSTQGVFAASSAQSPGASKAGPT